MLLTTNFRMLIHWRTYNRAKKGTIQYQALVRGYNVRKLMATIEVQKYYRRYIAKKKYTMLQSAILSLQTASRARTARKFLNELKKEQKDVGKLKGMNEKLKQEMASLRAMLSAQAKESAADEKHKKAIQAKEQRIAELEKKIKDIEKELDAAKKMVEKLESDIARQAEEAAKDKEQIHQLRTHRRGRTPESPIQTRKIMSGHSGHPPPPPPEGMPADYVSPEVLAEHRSRVAKLQEELEEERTLRREADGEIIKLRAAMSGVKLNEDDVDALLAPQRAEAVSEESSIADEEMKR